MLRCDIYPRSSGSDSLCDNRHGGHFRSFVAPGFDRRRKPSISLELEDPAQFVFDSVDEVLEHGVERLVVHGEVAGTLARILG